MNVLLVLFFWISVPVFSILIAGYWLWKAESLTHRRVAKITCTLWFVYLAWFMIGGERILLDRKVDKLCAQDGGIKIYETVSLAPDKFDKWGNVNIPEEGKLKFFEIKPDYYWNNEMKYLKKGDPDLYRDLYRIFRRIDKKLLGESIRYARRGGDLPGPWHNSSYSCPENLDLAKQIFFKKSEKEEIDNE